MEVATLESSFVHDRASAKMFQGSCLKLWSSQLFIRAAEASRLSFFLGLLSCVEYFVLDGIGEVCTVLAMVPVEEAVWDWC